MAIKGSSLSLQSPEGLELGQLQAEIAPYGPYGSEMYKVWTQILLVWTQILLVCKGLSYSMGTNPFSFGSYINKNREPQLYRRMASLTLKGLIRPFKGP